MKDFLERQWEIEKSALRDSSPVGTPDSEKLAKTRGRLTVGVRRLEKKLEEMEKDANKKKEGVSFTLSASWKDLMAVGFVVLAAGAVYGWLAR